MTDLFVRLVDRTSRLAEMLAVILLFGFAGLMLAEVITRGFIGGSLAFSWEFSTYAMAGMFFLAAGRTLRTGRHVRVSLFLEMAPPKVSRFIDILANVVGIVVTLVIFWAVLQLFLNSMARGSTAATYSATPLMFPQGLLVLGAGQLCLDMFARLIRLLKNQPPQEVVEEEEDDEAGYGLSAKGERDA